MNAVGPATQREVLDDIAKARKIAFACWTIRDPNVYLDAIEAAADRGAHVEAYLEKHPWMQDTDRAKELARQNTIAAQHLRKHGVRVHMVDFGDDEPMHLKTVIVDERRAYSNDHNWRKSAADDIVRTERPQDVAMLRSALEGRTGATGDFATRKDFALALEAALIERAPAGTPVYASSETFDHNVVGDALRRRALRGEEVDIVADARSADMNELADLVRSGAHVKLGNAVGKACVAGASAWTGSANATNEKPETVEWGLVSTATEVVARARDLFARAWQSGKAVAA